jgi:MFS family permease
MLFLLRNDDYFGSQSGVRDDNIGTLVAWTLFWQLLAQLVTSILIGFVYDIFGRKLTVIISYILIIVALMLIPYTAPSIALVCLVRSILGVGIQA